MCSLCKCFSYQVSAYLQQTNIGCPMTYLIAAFSLWCILLHWWQYPGLVLLRDTNPLPFFATINCDMSTPSNKFRSRSFEDSTMLNKRITWLHVKVDLVMPFVYDTKPRSRA